MTTTSLLFVTTLLSSFYPLFSGSGAGLSRQDDAPLEAQAFDQLVERGFEEPLEQINAEPVVSELERLDADALALLTARLDLESYANLLRASPILLHKARLPDYQEHQKLAEAAKIISTLDYYNYDQRNQLQSLLRGARMLYRLRSQVPMLLEADEGEPLREIANRFLLTYEECTGLAKSTLYNQERWTLSCLEAFAVKNYLVRLWAFLPQGFRSDHLLDACVVAIRQRNLKAFGYFAKIAKTKNPQVLRQRVIPESVGKSGDMELYKAAIDFWPAYRTIKFRQIVALGAAEAGQLELLQQLLQAEVFTDDLSNLKSKVIIAACAYGQLELIKHYRGDRRVHRLEPLCIVGAAKGGHLNILKHFLWDDGADMPKGGSRLPYAGQVYQKALCEALRHNRMDVVRFLMRRSQNGQQCWPAVTPAAGKNEALAIAFSQGNWPAIEMFLERDEPGAPRFSDFTLGGFGNRVLLETVKVGRLDMIEFMVRGVDNNMDARYDDLDFAVNGNSPLEIAADHGHVEIVRYFLRKKAEGHPSFQAIDVAARNGAILHAACRAGRLEVVRLLMAFSYNEDGLRDRWANGAHRGEVAVDGPLARPNGNNRAAAAAVPPLLDPAVRSNRALRLAIKGGYVEIVELLLQRVDGVRRYPNVFVRYSNLVRVAETGHSTMFRTLLPHVPPDDIPTLQLALPLRANRAVEYLALQFIGLQWPQRTPLLAAALRSRDYDTIKLALRCHFPAVEETVDMDEVVRLVLQEMVYEVPHVLLGPIVRELRGLPYSDWDRAFTCRAYQHLVLGFVQRVLVETVFACIWQQKWVPPLASVFGVASRAAEWRFSVLVMYSIAWALNWLWFWLRSVFSDRD